MNSAALHASAAVPEGWNAQLTLEFVARGPRTVLGACHRQGPLTVQRPFYPEDDVCHVYLLHPPGGVAGGDTLTVDCTVQSGARAVVTTPGATKFYRTNGPAATQHQNLHVASCGQLEWLPQENIFFESADVASHTHITLADDAALAWWEIHCLGRPVNNITFDEGRLRSTLTLERDGNPVLIERLRVAQGNRHDITGLRGLPICATAIFGPADTTMLDTVRTLTDAADAGISGVTRIEDFLVVRHLGLSSEFARKLFATIWVALRPRVYGLEACQPRIWRT